MQMGYGPTSPATPAPIPPATQWWDVNNWQYFLKTRSFLTGTSYPTNLFDNQTSMATKNFQQSTQYQPVLPPTGIVDLNTYNKAVAAGMIAFPTVG